MTNEQEIKNELYVICCKTIKPETMSNLEIAKILENARDTENWIKRMFSDGSFVWYSFLEEIAKRIHVLETLRNAKC